MTFTKKSGNVPENYNINFDKFSKKWRLRIKREGKWETAGRFETEALAVSFANQSSKFNEKVKTDKVEKKLTKAEKNEAAKEATTEVTKVQEPVKEPVGTSTLDKVRASARGSKGTKAPAPAKIAKPTALEQVVNQLESAGITTQTQIPSLTTLAGRSQDNLQALKMQSRIADLQKTVDTLSGEHRSDRSFVDAAVHSMVLLEKDVKASLSDYGHLRDNLREIITEKLTPHQRDVETLFHQLTAVQDSLSLYRHESHKEEEQQEQAIKALQAQVATASRREMVLMCLVALCFIVTLAGTLR